MPRAKPRPRLAIREVRSTTDPAFGAVYRLLQQAFTGDKLLPRSEWDDAIQERTAGLWTDMNWHVFVARRGRRVVGAGTGTYLGAANVGLIGYITVRRSERVSGLGGRLRRALQVAFQRDAQRITGRPLEALVGEVHADNPWLRTLVRRAGALALDFPYYAPDMARRSQVALVLYYQPLGPARMFLPAADVRRLVFLIWRRIYRVPRPLNRPGFRRMLRALAGRRRIGAARLPPPKAPST